MQFAEFFKTLSIQAPDQCFADVLDETFAEYEKSGVYFLEDSYIECVNSCENCLSNCLEETIEAAKMLRGNKELSLYALFLHRAMAQRARFLEHLHTFVFPAGEDAAQRFLPFLVLLPEIPKLYTKLKARSVPEDIVAASLRQFEDCLFLTRERTGSLGYLKRYFDHMQGYVDEKILNIGRLRFEMVQAMESDILVLRNPLGETAVLFDGATINSAGKLYKTPPEAENGSYFTAIVEESETAFSGFPAEKTGNCASSPREYPKNIWKPALRKGDAVLSVHIPNKGALTKEACEDSYRRAQAVFRTCYPAFSWKAFRCHSWLLDPQLEAFLPEYSNILAFQRKFTLYAGQSQGQDVFNFVFKLQSQDYRNIPEDTSLQRALKKHYLAGNFIYEYEGIFFAADQGEHHG